MAQLMPLPLTVSWPYCTCLVDEFDSFFPQPLYTFLQGCRGYGDFHVYGYGASCSEKMVRVWVCRILGFCGYGDPVGYLRDFLWVWDGYGDRNSVPTAAMPNSCSMPNSG